MARPLPLSQHAPSTSHVALAAMSLAMCAFAVFMCASHSLKRRRHGWSSCRGGEDPVIEIQNEAVTQQQEASIWQKNILMGGKCQLPDFSGVIIYDSNGNALTPSKTSRPLLTWK